MKTELDNILSQNNVDALFLYSDSSRYANMYYLTQFFAPDAFLYLKKIDQEPTILVSQMEQSRAQKQSTVKNVKSYFEYNYQEVVKSAKNPKLGSVKFIAEVVKNELGLGSKICVPADFPLLVADFLRKERLTISPMLGVVEKARETKDPQEVETIKKMQQINEKVTSEAIDLIANSEVGANKTLLHDKEPLTVGKMKAFFGHKLLENGCLPEEDIIVACGPEGSDPHYSGEAEDKLKADQPIILDIYPRSIQKRYWTDMTRTVVKGKASPEVKKMFEAVFEAKNASLDAVYAGAIGTEVYNVCCDVLEKKGYQTTRSGQQVTVGMTHGLGHGVGLQIHESPRINEFSGSPLKEHVVVTIEPGVYNPKVGGLRLEDIIEVTKQGCNNLTSMKTVLEI